MDFPKTKPGLDSAVTKKLFDGELEQFKDLFQPKILTSEDDPSPSSVGETAFVDPFQMELEEGCDSKPLVSGVSSSSKNNVRGHAREENPQQMAPRRHSMPSSLFRSEEWACEQSDGGKVEDDAGQEEKIETKREQIRVELINGANTVGLDACGGDVEASGLYVACIGKSGGQGGEVGIAGMVFERADVLPRAAMVTGRHSIAEFDHFKTDEDQRLYVKTVATGSAAEAAGVTIGSTLVTITGQPVAGKSCAECVALITEAWDRVMSRPAGPSISLQLRRGEHQPSHSAVPPNRLHGGIFARVSSGGFSVGGFRGGKMQYKPKYYVFGGCNTNHLQLFESEAHYQTMQSSTAFHVLPTKLPTIRLTKYHRCSPIKHKMYKGHGGLYYFKLEIPFMKFTAAKFGASWSEDADALRNALRAAIEMEAAIAMPCVDSVDHPSRPGGRRNSTR
jgi:hypothetical protein